MKNLSANFCVRARLGSAPFLLGALMALSTPTSALDLKQDFGIDGNLKLSTGIDFSSGKYGGTEKTDILFVPLAAQYEQGNLRLKVTVPYISIEGPGGVVGGPDGPIIIGGGDAAVTSESGLGDIVASASYLIEPSGDNMPWFEITGKVKIATANETKGLGTGKTDFYVQGDVFQSFGKLTPFATFGYRMPGDPLGVDLRNTFYGSLGLGYKFSDTASAGLILDYREKTTVTSSQRLELVPYAVIKTGQGWAVNIYGVVGLSDGSPDGGVGLQLSYAL